MLCIGIDVGGTFTDLVAVDAQGRVTLAKAASTPGDQSLGVMDGLDRLAEALGLDRAAMLARHRAHRPRHHGRDQRAARAQGRQGRPADHRGPSRHHRDARGAEGRPLQSAPAAAEQLVPRERRLGVRERMRPDGRVEIALDRGSLRDAIARPEEPGRGGRRRLLPAQLARRRHERITAEAVRAAMPGVYVCALLARCCRRSRSTSASAPRSSTPMSARRWSAT